MIHAVALTFLFLWTHTQDSSCFLHAYDSGQADSIAQQSVNRVVSSAAHWQDSNGAYATYGTHLDTGVDFPDQWQIFRVDWTLDSVRTFVDGQHIWSLDISGEPTFHQPFYLLANMAVGGQLPVL